MPQPLFIGYFPKRMGIPPPVYCATLAPEEWTEAQMHCEFSV